MKKKIASAVILVLAVILIGISIFSFQKDKGDTLSEEQKKELEKEGEEIELEREARKNTPAQEGEADEISQKLAEKIHREAEKVVSVGKPIKNGFKEFTATSWEIRKENPGYPLPSGRTFQDIELSGAEIDENGNITNEYSYVVVDISVKNTRKSEALTQLIWGTIRLQVTNHREYLGEYEYLGENPAREYNKSYSQETIQPGESVEKALIYIAPDEILEEEDIYLKIDPSGANEADALRFIALHVH